MQALTRKQLIDKAVSLLDSNTVSAVLGWKRGEFDYDITPAVFISAFVDRGNFMWLFWT